MVDLSFILQWGNLIVLVATAIWAVTKIKITTEMLSLSITHLRESLDRLDKNYTALNKEFGTTRDRITVLETHCAEQNKVYRRINGGLTDGN